MFLSAYEWEAVVLSLQVAGTAVIFSLPVGILGTGALQFSRQVSAG